MLIFVYGNDTFRVREKVTEMKDRFKEKFDPTGLNLLQVNGKPVLGEVMQAVQSAPFMGSRRLVIVRDLCVGMKKAEASDWILGLQKTPDSTIVILWETSDPEKVEKAELFKGLKKASDVHYYPFPELTGSALSGWIRDRAKQLSVDLSPEALFELSTRVGADLWRTQNELEKLSGFADGKPVTTEMVRTLVHADFEDQMFAFIDALSQRQSKAALRLLEEERLSGAADTHLFGMLLRQIRLLLAARLELDRNPNVTKQDLAESMSLHPFVAQKTLGQAKAFSTEQLKTAHDRLFTLDADMKIGRVSAGTAVDITISRFLNS